MDKITVFRTVKNPKIAATILGIAIAMALSLLLFMIIIGPKSHLYLITLFCLFVCNMINAFYPVYLFNVKYIINETDNTFRVKGDCALNRVIAIDNIHRIDVYRSKKGEIRYFLLRTPPSAYLRIRPYHKQQFLSNMLKLNPTTEVKYF